MIRYALVEGVKSGPLKGLKGVCPGCRQAVTAKCGSIKIHHWAHLRNMNCDPWWEPMTQWHINWQGKFPESWREVVLQDSESGEFHRADIHTPDGVTIEFQHSPLAYEELEKRNRFYSKLIWVVNGQRFAGNFKLTAPIPDPAGMIMADYDFHMNGYGEVFQNNFALKQDLMDYGVLVKRYNQDSPELASVYLAMQAAEPLCWLFNWAYKHVGWFSCAAPVFLDFGNEYLYRLRKRQQVMGRFWYIKKIKKSDFLAKYGADNSDCNTVRES